MAEVDNWIPKTKLGKMVKNGEIKSIDEIIDKGYDIKEPEIVDILLPNLESDLILIGHQRGKSGGGRRKAYKNTQKVTAEGKRIKFTSLAIVGNRDGYIGMGLGSSNETVPAKAKAIRNAKLNIIRIKRACGSWECACGSPHSIPCKVRGKSGSVIVEIKPAPKGLGLCISSECRKILELAGIKDVWSKTFGKTATRVNLAVACFNALKQISKMKVKDSFSKESGLVEGALNK